MAGLLGVLDTASRALQINQRGVATAGHNIANVNTPGFSRQRQVLAPARAIVNSTGNLGSGVEQLSIERIADIFIHRQLMEENAVGGSLDAQAETLTQIDRLLNEQQSEGVTSALSDLYNAFEDLASTPAPGQPVERQNLRTIASSLIDIVHRLDDELRQLQSSEDDAIAQSVADVNTLAERIADLNTQILRQDVVATANDLRDQRDQALRDLAKEIDVTTFVEDDTGMVIVMLAGGVPLVDGERAARLVEVPDPTNPFDPNYSQVFFDDGANFFDLTNEIGGGELGGLLRSRDTIVADAIRSLDTLAYNLAAIVNTQHQAGVGLDGVTARDFFSPLAQVEDAARDLALSADVVASTNAIAAGGAGGTGAPGDNRNALLLAALDGQSSAIFVPGDPPGPATGSSQTVLEFAGGMLADIGQQARSIESARSQHANILEGIENRRDAISGVSLDEEMTDLIRLQAAFQANARIVSAVDGMLQNLIDIL